jgi:hypothetical protein
MEFFSGHDIDGDGKNDIYVRHKVKGDPVAGMFLFILTALVTLGIGLPYASYSIFSHFLLDPKNFPSSLMRIIFFGSLGVIGISFGWFCGKLGRSYSVPFGALGVFFAIGFLWVGIINVETATNNKNIEDTKLKDQQNNSEYWQKKQAVDKAIENKIKPIQEKLIATAHSRGWKIDDTSSWRRPEFDLHYSISALAPPLQDLRIQVNVFEGQGANWKTTIHGYSEEAKATIYSNEGKDFILDKSLENLGPGKLKDLTNELAGYLYSLKVAAEKAYKEINQEATDTLPKQPEKAKDTSNPPGNWIAISLTVSFALAILGGIFLLKRKNKPVSPLPTPAPPQDKPAITTAQRYKYTCSGCSARYKLTHDALGKSFPCKKCKITCWVPMDVDQLSIE